VPEVGSVQSLNAMIDQWDAADEIPRTGSRARTVGEFLEIERPLLKPVPAEPFETGRWFTPRVDRFAQVTVRTNRYSVPVRLIGRRVRVLLHASALVVYDGHTEVARHERLPGKSSARLDLDHYPEALVRKPGALPGSTALEQALRAGAPTADAVALEARKAADAGDHPATDENVPAEPTRPGTHPRRRPLRCDHRDASAPVGLRCEA
jgi:hypothetical protein